MLCITFIFAMFPYLYVAVDREELFVESPMPRAHVSVVSNISALWGKIFSTGPLSTGGILNADKGAPF
jgi:hypothetical protein